jgi:FRG domain.
MLVITSDEPVKSLSDFFTRLQLKTTNFKDTLESAPYIFWFRGQADSTWTLMPRMYRKLEQSINFNDSSNGDLFNISQFRDFEENTDFDFFTEANSFLNKSNIASTRWNRYYLKQHYGIPTRLLDWSQNIMVALYFALSEFTDDKSKNARIWILSPFHLNKGTVEQIYDNKDISKPSIFCFCEDEFDKKGKIINDDNSLNIERLSDKYMFIEDIEESEIFYPLAIKPTLLDERMKSQQSCFTIFSNKINGIIQNTFSKNPIFFIDIDGNCKRNIYEQLSEIGISQYFVYPDLDGLCKAINEKYKYNLDITRQNINLNNVKRKI